MGLLEEDYFDKCLNGSKRMIFQASCKSFLDLSIRYDSNLNFCSVNLCQDLHFSRLKQFADDILNLVIKSFPKR